MTSDCNLLGKFSLDGIPPMPRGQPQIDVTFDIDANGVLHVSALEKSTGKDQKIQIKNDKGRLSDEEITRMVDEAERYKAEDEANKLRVEAKNSLENYTYSLKSTMADEQLSSQMGPEDKETVNNKIAETMAWLSSNQLAEKDELEAKHQELGAVVNPVLQKSPGGGGGMPAGDMPGKDTGGMPTEESIPADQGPQIDEID